MTPTARPLPRKPRPDDAKAGPDGENEQGDEDAKADGGGGAQVITMLSRPDTRNCVNRDRQASLPPSQHCPQSSDG